MFLAKQLVLPTNLHAASTNIAIVAHRKIGEEVVTHAKPKVEHKKEKKNKTPSTIASFEAMSN